MLKPPPLGKNQWLNAANACKWDNPMRWLMFAVVGSVGFLAMGCGGDPASSRLYPGQVVEAVASEMSEKIVMFDSPDVIHETEIDRLILGPGLGYVAVGTKLKVIADDQPEIGHDPDLRDIVVEPMDGRHRGLTGTVSRRRVRPVR